MSIRRLTTVLLAAGLLLTGCSSGDGSAGAAHGSTRSTATTTTVPDRGDAAPESTTVFRAGDDGYAAFRIPAVVRAGDGTLLAFAEGRVSSAADNGDVDLVLKRSHDDGRTWGSLQVVADDGANFVGNPSPVVDRRSGRVAVLATHKAGGDTELQILAGTGVDTSRVWLLTSTDNGAAWSRPDDITDSVKPAGWRWYTVGPGHALQLRHGSHPGRLVAAANHTTETMGPGDHVLLSDDGGLTWRVGADDTPGPGGVVPDESTAAERPDGTILFSSRNQDEAAPWHRLQTTSTDGGDGYATPFAEQPGLVVPVVQGSLLPVGGQGGGVLLFSAPSDRTQRIDLRVRRSTDGGATWSGGTLVAPGPAAYSDLVELPGRRVGVLHETGSAGPYERIDLTVLGVDRVE